ncbi:uncharacterized protein LOC144360342 isoform X2 [Saccoglossus kowalevskii]
MEKEKNNQLSLTHSTVAPVSSEQLSSPSSSASVSTVGSYSISQADIMTGSMVSSPGSVFSDSDAINLSPRGDSSHYDHFGSANIGIKPKEIISSRKRREFIPDSKKDECYWDKRRKNNEAAKRSREKRRINDMFLETRVLHLSEENAVLKAELRALKQRLMMDTQDPRSAADNLMMQNQAMPSPFGQPMHPQSIHTHQPPPYSVPQVSASQLSMTVAPPAAINTMSTQSAEQVMMAENYPSRPHILRLQMPSLNEQLANEYQRRESIDAIRIKEEPDVLKYGYGDSNDDARQSAKRMPGLIHVRHMQQHSNDGDEMDFERSEITQQENGREERDEISSREIDDAASPKSRSVSPPPKTSSPHSVYSRGAHMESHQLPLKLRRKPKPNNYDENTGAQPSDTLDNAQPGSPKSPNADLDEYSSSNEESDPSRDGDAISQNNPDVQQQQQVNKEGGEANANVEQHERNFNPEIVPTPPPSSDSDASTSMRSVSPASNSEPPVSPFQFANATQVGKFQVVPPAQMFPTPDMRLREEYEKRKKMIIAAQVLSEMNPGFFKGQMPPELQMNSLREEDQQRKPRDDMTEEEKYLDKRRRNNEAAKKCRDIRRALYEYRNARSAYLEYENVQLRTELQILSAEISDLKEMITQKHKRRQQQLALQGRF